VLVGILESLFIVFKKDFIVLKEKTKFSFFTLPGPGKSNHQKPFLNLKGILTCEARWLS